MDHLKQAARMSSARQADLLTTLVRHDHAIGDLGRRMEGVETGIRGIDGKIDGIGGAISEMKGARGPDAQGWLKIAVTGGVLVSMSAAAVSFLVEARSAPDMANIKTSLAKMEAVTARREATEQAELAEYRRKREAEIDDMRQRIGWQAQVRTR